jgi:hypothetical protein
MQQLFEQIEQAEHRRLAAQGTNQFILQIEKMGKPA